MTTHPTPATAAEVDRALDERNITSLHVLHAHLTAGTLQAAGSPAQLPALLFPDVDPQLVQRIWDAALPVGFRAGRLVSAREWDPAALDRLRAALHEAGHERMAARIGHVLPTGGTGHQDDDDTPGDDAGGEHPDRHTAAAHPADTERDTTRPQARP